MDDHEAYFRDHINIIQGQEHLRDWLKNWYLAEARETWHHLKIHSGDIDHLPYLQSYEDQCPGNECMFYRNRGATMEDVEIRPENAPHITNVMIEALAQHDHRQTEARDCQEYQWQLGSTDLPGVAFLPPRTVDRDVTTELDPALLEGVVGTTAAPEPLSSTTASELSDSTAPIPEKKKITLDEYNRRKGLKLQQTVASPNLDENGECLDYDDFEPEDDPNNIQIDYQMPAPSPASSPQTSIPPLKDAPMPLSPATTQSEVSTGPGSILSAMGCTPTAVNWAPGFSRGLPVQRTMPIQVGAPQDLTSPMQIGTPHSLSLQPPTSSPALQITPMQEAPPCQATTAMQNPTLMMPIKLSTLTYSSEEASGPTSTAEDELLQGATLLCSPWWEASLLNIATPMELTKGSSEDDGHPQVPRQLQPTVHLWISASPIMGMDPSQSSSQLPYTTGARCPVSSRVLQSHQQLGYCHSGAPPGLNMATTGRSPHSLPWSRDRSSSDQYGVPWTGLKRHQ